MRIVAGVQDRPIEYDGTNPEPRSDAELNRLLVEGRRTNRRSTPTITVSMRPMTSDEEAGAAEALVGLVARLVRGRLQHKEK